MGIGGQDSQAGLCLLPIAIIIVLYGVWYNRKERKKKETTIVSRDVPPVVNNKDVYTEPAPQSAKSPVDKREYDYTAWCVEHTIDIPCPKWFVGIWGIGKPSPAEQLIIDQLNRYDCIWEREVSFEDLQLESKGWARFDFMLVDHNTCIEYDGKLAHSTPERQTVDNMKTMFCQKYKINLIRYNSKHYYHMEKYVGELMKSLSIQLR